MTTKEGLLANVDVEGIVKASIKGNRDLLIDEEKERAPAREVETVVNESYVAEPKQYKQVSERVSQKTKDAHVQLYRGYIESLNRTSAELDTADRQNADSKHSDFRSLKHDETMLVNAVQLHEAYFANAFDPRSEIFMDSSAYMELEKSWGTFDDWQKDFIACAMSCGEGWAVCGWNLFLKRFVNTTLSGNDKHVMVGLYPVIVVDVHEHAYFRDRLTDKKSYIMSTLQELNWNVIEERVNKAKALREVLK